jgi:hypothetical protein
VRSTSRCWLSRSTTTPEHPVVLAAERRIVELHNRKTQLQEALTAAEAEEPAKPAPELADILETLPDLRPALESYSEEELADLFDAFDLEARYNHLEKTVALSVTVFPELAQILEDERPLEAAGRGCASPEAGVKRQAHRVLRKKGTRPSAMTYLTISSDPRLKDRSNGAKELG